MIKDKKFPFYLRRSFYIHCVLFALTLVSGKVMLDKQAELRNVNLELIQASVRVDMVAMPKYTLEELKHMEAEATPPAAPEPTPAPVKEPEKVVEKVPAEVKEDFKNKLAKEVADADKHQSFLTKLKQISDKKVSDKKSKGSSKDTADIKRLVLAGNKISQGTQTYGDGHGSDLTAFQAYVTRLPERVRRYWRLPSFLLDKKLKCRVRVWIAMDGSVTHTEIYQSSGDAEYDKKALEAVAAASPFPELSNDFAKRALDGEILLGFPL